MTDDLPIFRDQRQGLAEHLDRADAAMQQDQRIAAAVDLVLHPETVHLGIITDEFIETELLTLPGDQLRHA